MTEGSKRDRTCFQCQREAKRRRRHTQYALCQKATDKRFSNNMSPWQTANWRPFLSRDTIVLS
jgi:hypothetical protein